jgi:hypothetical protein
MEDLHDKLVDAGAHADGVDQMWVQHIGCMEAGGGLQRLPSAGRPETNHAWQVHIPWVCLKAIPCCVAMHPSAVHLESCACHLDPPGGSNTSGGIKDLPPKTPLTLDTMPCCMACRGLL